MRVPQPPPALAGRRVKQLLLISVRLCSSSFPGEGGRPRGSRCERAEGFTAGDGWLQVSQRAPLRPCSRKTKPWARLLSPRCSTSPRFPHGTVSLLFPHLSWFWGVLGCGCQAEELPLGPPPPWCRDRRVKCRSRPKSSGAVARGGCGNNT